MIGFIRISPYGGPDGFQCAALCFSFHLPFIISWFILVECEHGNIADADMHESVGAITAQGVSPCRSHQKTRL
ncbi:hypothetical protein BT96DRAFT_631678 [Gymnopus androsaceus JB14]|uniref:Uncharacterized protein n=1 Tax=Gymnopus androsaceus JB14 TaxID=1447944 RepID=A0A6A4HSX5_9AGAR|nr:hypothetical protein BT96DRAFT_631678 [Gymnopus androsaceus JB14]